MVKAIRCFNNKNKINVNCREFYEKHPDLAPRNVYLYLGRVITKEDADKKFAKIFKEPFITRAKNWFQNKIGKLFNRDTK